MSETQTVTIADFLLARLVEDEAEARDAASRHQVEQSRGAFVCTEEGAHVGYSPAHVLAECEAKGRTVERITDGCRHPWVSDDGTVVRMVGGWCLDCDAILGLLALPYADHPDYRPEWRP